MKRPLRPFRTLTAALPLPLLTLLVQPVTAQTSSLTAGEPETRTVSFTATEGTALGFDISPDGRWIVFDLLGQLWRIPADGGEAVALTDAVADLAEDIDPSFSPDGGWILFQGDRGGRKGLWIMPAEGGEPELLPGTETAPSIRWKTDLRPAWSPGGRQIAFVRERRGASHGRMASEGGAHVHALERGITWRLEWDDPDVGPARGVAWHPSGRLLIDLGAEGWWLADPATGSRERLTAHGYPSHAVPSPDGRRWAYVTMDEGGDHRLQVRGDGEGEPEALVPHHDVAQMRLRWTPDGMDILYSAGGRLWRVAADGGEPREIPFTARIEFEREEPDSPQVRFPEPGTDVPARGHRGLAISPDGERIALIALGRLWVWPVDGEPRAVADVPATAAWTGWAPNGREVVWSAGPGGAEDLYVTNLGTGASRRLTALPGRAYRPSWSPDGRHIAFIYWPGPAFPGSDDPAHVTARFGVIPSGSGLVDDVSQVLLVGEIPDSWMGGMEPMGQELPAWSPGSDALLLYDGLDEAHVVPLAGEPVRLEGPVESMTFLHWGVDSSLVYVQGAQLWRAGIRGGVMTESVRLTDGAALYPSVARDGTILYVSADGYRLRRPGGSVESLGWPLWYRIPAAAPPLLIRDARIIDGTGAAPRRPSDVLLEHGRIARIGPAGSIRPHAGVEIVEAEGRSLLPGLIDLHVHGWDDLIYPAALYHGVTTVREMGSPIARAAALSDAAAAGIHPGPRVILGGFHINPGAPFAFSGASLQNTMDPDASELALDLAEAFGATYVKMQFPGSWSAGVELIRRAHARGLRIGGHCAHPLPLIAAGVDQAEHSGDACRPAGGWPGQPLPQDDLMRLYGEAGVTLVPTITVLSGLMAIRTDPGIMDVPGVEPFLTPSLRLTSGLHHAPEPVEDWFYEALSVERTKLATGLFHAAGVAIATGTDALLPGAIHLEMEELVAAGLSPLEAIAAATATAARVLGAQDEIGTIEEGRIADLLLLDADPLEDIRNTREIYMIIQGGRVVDREGLLERGRETQPNGEPNLPLQYPETPTVDIVDDYHGTLVPDPYRWLEEMDSPEVGAWVEAQNSLTHGFLDQLPGRPLLRERLAELWTHEQATPPVRVGDRYFYRYSDGTHEQPLLYWREGLDGKPRVLIDPNTFAADGSITLGGFSPSPDGRLISYIVRDGRRESIRIRDVESGLDLEDRLEVDWTTWQMPWTGDGRGFFYTCCSAEEEKPVRVYYHRLGTGQNEDLVVYERPDEPDLWFTMAPSHPARYLVIVIWDGLYRNTGISVLDLVDPERPRLDTPVRPVIDKFDAFYLVVGNDGDTLFLTTNLDAPRSRIIAIDLQHPEREHWRTVIPETEDVLSSAGLAGDLIATRYIRDVVPVVRLHRLDGGYVRDIEFPTLGAAALFPNRYGEVFYRFSSHLNPRSIYRLDLKSGETSVFHEPELDFDASGFVTRQVFYGSKDGTRVPMFVTHRRDLVLDGTNPTLLTGYGGYGLSATPSFSPERLGWLEMGGIYAIANIRGGGEYGAEWHQAGIRENRQVVFDDFIAAAEYLIAEGYTSAERLAISGASNGGLLVGAVMTQRPDLFAAAVLHGSVLDMLRYPYSGGGAGWTSEYGSPDDPDIFPVLYGYSPVHNVKPGTCYPATLLMHSEHDVNVVPMHSYKFGAALQKAQSCDRPVLLRVERLSGHGTGRTQSMLIEAATDQWSFLAEALGISMQDFRNPTGASALPPVQLSSAAPATVVVDTIKITVEEATNLTLDVSPDGRTIAFTLFDRLWLLPAEGGTARPLTGPAEYAASAPPSAWPAPGMPAWSPDSEWLAFASPGGLSAVHPGSGERRQLTFDPDDSRPRWLSPERLSFVTQRAWPTDRPGWPPGDSEVWILDLSSGAQRTVSPRFERLTAYAWSPDGEMLAVAGTPAGDSAGVWLVDPERRALLTRFIDGADHGPLAWGADGRLVAARQVSHNEHEIISHLLGGDGASLSVTAADTLPGGSDLHSIAWQPQEGILYGADGRIWRSTGGIRWPVPFHATVTVLRPRYDRKTPRLGIGARGREVKIALTPAISPDGRRIVFSALGELQVLEPVGEVRTLTSGALFPLDPAWSPDGDRIAFAAPGDGGHVIRIVDVDGGGSRSLTDFPGGQLQPRWSPDGRRIAFSCPAPCADGSGSAIGWISADGDTVRLVHSERREPMRVAGWTEGGREIVFHAHRRYGEDRPERPGGPDRMVPWEGRLWAVPADSGSVVPWGPPLSILHPAVSMDGTAILYQHEGALWRLGVEGPGDGPEAEPEQLAPEFADWPSASADGRHVAYFSTEGLTRLDTGTGNAERVPLLLGYTFRHPPPLVVAGVRLFDGSGSVPTGPVDIWTEEGRVQRITPAGAEAPDVRTTVLDGGNALVLPGLIDSHVHPSATDMPVFLSEGVTTVRDTGTDLLSMLALREAIEGGVLPGPRLLVAGHAVDPAMNTPTHPGIDDIEMGRRRIERAAKLGADLVKFYNLRLPVEELIPAAHGAGLPVLSHGEGALVGLDGKEHAFGARMYGDWVQLHARGGLVLGPTMVIIFDIEHYASPDRERIHDFARDALDFTRRVHEAGGQIIAGTDVGSLHHELELLVLAGLTPAEALYSATGGAAKILGIEEQVGTVEPGRLADLIILEPGADPFTDIRDTHKIWTVIQGGRVVDREGLREWARAPH